MTYLLLAINTKKNSREPHKYRLLGNQALEVSPRFGLGMRVLQTLALPLGYDTGLERTTRLELATSTMARWRSTR